MSNSRKSFSMKFNFNHKNNVLGNENTVITQPEMGSGGSWGTQVFISSWRPWNNPPPPLIQVFPIQLCSICSILSHPWGMLRQRRVRRKRKGSASVLCASPPLTSCGAEEAEPGGAEPSRSEWGRSWRGDKLEARGNFLQLFSSHSRQMTNSR